MSRPANVGEQGRKGVDELVEHEASLLGEVDAPGQAREIGGSK